MSTVIRMWPVDSLRPPRARAGGRVGSGGQQKSIGERNRWAREQVKHQSVRQLGAHREVRTVGAFEPGLQLIIFASLVDKTPQALHIATWQSWGRGDKEPKQRVR